MRKEARLEALLEYLRDTRGFDFTGYKRASLRRRIEKRMSDVRISDIGEYLDHLQAQPDEFEHLFNTILINVTSFFRDKEAWEYLRSEIVPSLVGDPDAPEPIRAWSAGCASGEETYSIAMLLAEALGEENYRRRVKVYGTDVDEEALSQARHASYTEASLTDVAEEMRTRFFELSAGRYTFLPELRRSVIFGRHDLVQDAPIARMDLIVCRNVLMYFNSEVQERILGNLHFALKDSGYLFLGRAEMMLSHSSQFELVHLSHRLSRRRPTQQPRVLVPAFTAGPEMPPVGSVGVSALDQSSNSILLLDASRRLILANHRARALFSLTESDLGKRFQDLEMSYRPFELRSQVEDSISAGKPVTMRDLQRTLGDGSIQHLEIKVIPLRDGIDGLLGVSIQVEDVSVFKQLQAERTKATQELETAYEELQSTNEELETTNEELQSTVEELETTNEELQSTNEELETTNEELQSTNAELQAVNEEYQRIDGELRAINAFMGAVLTSIHIGLVVVNERLDVLTWNQHAEELWGMRADETRGKSLMELDIGLPVKQLRTPIVACLTGSAEEKVKVDAINRRGQPVTVGVTCTPLLTDTSAVQEVVILMETVKRPT